MPSKLRRVIATIKDQTSISLAKVSATNLEVAILKATTHEELPVDDCFVNRVHLLTFSSRAHAATCIHALERRIARTHNWVVALKSLNLVFRILQEGDPHFDQELFRASKCGIKLLDLSNFRDESNTSPWDYTAFVRTFALYLYQRLHCTLMGKLHRSTRPGHHHHQHSTDHVHFTMKPTVLLDKITYWQRLLDRAIATQPTGPAKTNRLVQLSLYSVVRESFDLYRDISNCLALVLDHFFYLEHQSCIEVFDTCNKAAKQFDELAAFYGLCKSIGVGRKVEYPSVEKLSERLLETLRELLKNNEDSSKISKPKRCELQFHAMSSDEDLKHELNSEEEMEQASSTSELGLIDLKETAATRPPLMDQDNKLSPGLLNLDSGNQQLQQQLPSSQFRSLDQDNNSNMDLVLLGDPPQHQQQGKNEGWETVLMECAEKLSNQANYNESRAIDSLLLESLYNHTSVYQQQMKYSNPFLQGDGNADVSLIVYSPFPPSLSANNPDQVSTLPLEADLFSSAYCIPAPALIQLADMSIDKKYSYAFVD